MDRLDLTIKAIASVIRDILEDTITPETIEIATHLHHLDNNIFLFLEGANLSEIEEVRKLCLEQLLDKHEVLHGIYNL